MPEHQLQATLLASNGAALKSNDDVVMEQLSNDTGINGKTDAGMTAIVNGHLGNSTFGPWMLAKKPVRTRMPIVGSSAQPIAREAKLLVPDFLYLRKKR
jgi:hypothetical protein